MFIEGSTRILYTYRMTICIMQRVNSLWEEHIKGIKNEFPDAVITADEELIGQAELIIASRISQETLEKAVTLKAVIAPMAGVDQLPLDYLAAKKIRVANVHGNAESVAERTVGLILAWYGNIIPYHLDLRKDRWHAFWLGRGVDDTWESVSGKRCTILGAGAIGLEIARRMRAFSTHITGYKRKQLESIPEEYDEMVYDIDEALGKGEIIISVLPSTPSTVGVINAERLSNMSGKVLVNVGRGDVIDEEALYSALHNGTLRGAALDCWYSYPDEGKDVAPSRFPFKDLPNVIMSPHVAGFTRDSVVKSVDQTFENLRSYLTDETFLYEIDLDTMY